MKQKQMSKPARQETWVVSNDDDGPKKQTKQRAKNCRQFIFATERTREKGHLKPPKLEN